MAALFGNTIGVCPPEQSENNNTEQSLVEGVTALQSNLVWNQQMQAEQHMQAEQRMQAEQQIQAHDIKSLDPLIISETKLISIFYQLGYCLGRYRSGWSIASSLSRYACLSESCTSGFDGPQVFCM